MKKNFLYIALSLAISLNGFLDVNAMNCEYGLQAPEINQVYASNKGKTVSLKTSYNSCMGENTAVYFSNFGSLPTNFDAAPGTIIHGYLYEEDPPGDDDEVVKYYIGEFTGHVLSNFYLQKTITPGIIDSTGDQNCELYMKFYISGHMGGEPIPQGLFYYSQCMK